MTGDVLDLLLLGACLAFGVSGYRQGFLVGVGSFAGFLAGGALAARFAPDLAAHYFPTANGAVVGLVAVFVAAVVGQALGATIGAALRRRVTWRAARFLDALAGAVVSVAGVLLAAWLLATAVAHSTLPALARQVRHSEVLAAIDEVMPDSARTWFSSFRRLLDNYPFPPVFGSLGPEQILSVRPPDPAVVADPDIRRAARSVVKITGTADQCSRRLEGSGFVYAPQHVLTNAHVVAGVRAPYVRPLHGPLLPARVVEYDPRRDVAVLYVPGLHRGPLAFATGVAPTGTLAVVAGYPEDGPFTAVAARVRREQQARGPDIYQRAQVTRSIYSIRARVRPGNSGGPLLAGDGRVYGVVFAAAVEDPDTGYALTAGEVRADASRGAHATAGVDTGGCD